MQRTGHKMCEVCCKMKIWDPCLYTIKNFNGDSKEH